MIFHHNFDLGDFHLLKDNEDGTAYFYKDDEFSDRNIQNYWWPPERRLYSWSQMITKDGHTLKFCKIRKCVVLKKYQPISLFSNETIYHAEGVSSS